MFFRQNDPIDQSAPFYNHSDLTSWPVISLARLPLAFHYVWNVLWHPVFGILRAGFLIVRRRVFLFHPVYWREKDTIKSSNFSGKHWQKQKVFSFIWQCQQLKASRLVTKKIYFDDAFLVRFSYCSRKWLIPLKTIKNFKRLGVLRRKKSCWLAIQIVFSLCKTNPRFPRSWRRRRLTDWIPPHNSHVIFFSGQWVREVVGVAVSNTDATHLITWPNLTLPKAEKLKRKKTSSLAHT